MQRRGTGNHGKTGGDGGKAVHTGCQSADPSISADDVRKADGMRKRIILLAFIFVLMFAAKVSAKEEEDLSEYSFELVV